MLQSDIYQVSSTCVLYLLWISLIQIKGGGPHWQHNTVETSRGFEIKLPGFEASIYYLLYNLGQIIKPL